jgi:uncharacterized membrane protein
LDGRELRFLACRHVRRDFILLGAACAYFVLVRALLAHHGRDSTLARALGRDFKGRISMVLYVVAIILAFLKPVLACSLYVAVAVMWLVPDRRIEKILQ